MKKQFDNAELERVWNRLIQKIEKATKKSFKNTKIYIALAKGDSNVLKLFPRKKFIRLDINRGLVHQDGTKSKGFFTMNDPNGLSKVVKYKAGDYTGQSYIIRIDNYTDLDYVLSLIMQKYNSK